MKKILVVSHCLLNTASKVKRFKEESIRAEEALRQDILKEAIGSGIQILQLPCPEFIMYGPCRWGHTWEQFDNIFYRSRCRELLEPVILQLKEYVHRCSWNRWQPKLRRKIYLPRRMGWGIQRQRNRRCTENRSSCGRKGRSHGGTHRDAPGKRAGASGRRIVCTGKRTCFQPDPKIA